jgi:hypothetical protein
LFESLCADDDEDNDDAKEAVVAGVDVVVVAVVDEEQRNIRSLSAVKAALSFSSPRVEEVVVASVEPSFVSSRTTSGRLSLKANKGVTPRLACQNSLVCFVCSVVVC